MEFRRKPTTKTITIVSNDKTAIPATDMDLVLRPKNGLKVQVQYFDLIDGTEITVNNKIAFFKKITQHVINKEYTTTDHLPVVVTITLPNGEQIKYMYVSLDNSVRSNINGYALKNRLNTLFDMVNKLIKNIGGKCFLFFSESGRPSFDGDMKDKKNEMNWNEMVKFIKEYCDIQYLGISRSNYTSDMSFGVSAFATKHFEKDEIVVHCNNILPVGFGSAVIGLDYEGINVFAVHFPLDFKGIGPENQGAISMTNLCNLMKEYPRSVCAFGDFNTVPGNIENSITNAVDNEFELIWPEFPTFFGSYYDTIPSNPNDQVQLLD